MSAEVDATQSAGRASNILNRGVGRTPCGTGETGTISST